MLEDVRGPLFLDAHNLLFDDTHGHLLLEDTPGPLLFKDRHSPLFLEMHMICC